MKYRDKILIIFIFFSYAFNISFLVSEEGRNYLAIASGLLSSILFIMIASSIMDDFPWNIPLFIYMMLVCLATDSLSNSISVILTLIYSMGYYAVMGLARKPWCNSQFIALLLKTVIYAFTIVALIQLIAYLVGLPVPNEISRKEGFSFNSLAMEPSHFGRVVGITSLAYILIQQLDISRQNYLDMIKKEWKIVISVILSTVLSGSTTALIALPLTFILSGNIKNSIPIMLVLIVVIIIGSYVEYEPIQRAFAFLPSLASMDAEEVQKADGSGALRVLPFLIYMQNARPGDLSFWFGYGPQGLIQFFLGAIKGIKDYAGQTGFVPGFAVMYGIFGNLLFFWTFLLNKRLAKVIPLIIFFLCFFFATPLNTSLMWYALIVISIVAEAKKNPINSIYNIYRNNLK